MNALQDQIGGDHYNKHSIQPWQIWEEYRLDPWEANALKYLLRRKHDRLEDLKKCRHYLDYLIEREENKDVIPFNRSSSQKD
jgi:hypothetical protein